MTAKQTVIDVDGHTFEPDELWERYLPRSLHARRPRLVRDERGTTRYELEGRIIPSGTGRGAWVPEGMRESAVHREGAVDPKLRLEDMDLEGIDVAVLYGVVSLGFYAMDDRELCNAFCRAYNDWLADYCATDPERLKGTPALPLKWIDDACVEAERVVRDLGFVSLTVPCAVGERNADDPENFALYELAQTLDVLAERGMDIVGLDMGGDLRIEDLEVGPGGMVLVVGSEGRGLRRLTRETCDQLVKIPMLGQVESLNVSVASGIVSIVGCAHGAWFCW